MLTWHNLLYGRNRTALMPFLDVKDIYKLHIARKVPLPISFVPYNVYVQAIIEANRARIGRRWAGFSVAPKRLTHRSESRRLYKLAAPIKELMDLLSAEGYEVSNRVMDYRDSRFNNVVIYGKNPEGQNFHAKVVNNSISSTFVYSDNGSYIGIWCIISLSPLSDGDSD